MIGMIILLQVKIFKVLMRMINIFPQVRIFKALMRMTKNFPQVEILKVVKLIMSIEDTLSRVGILKESMLMMMIFLQVRI
jgi:hypothetical protein